ncbi:MAG: single-stranded DNA-binding protein [Rickettsiales bacterium]|nr:single-stranded DNA-binding protein [Rickettsiales bacterium]
MVMAINKVILVGNVGKDPEIRSFGNGSKVANFSLATTDIWKDKTTHERKEKTEWHKIVIYSVGLVNIVEKYVKKGTRLYIEGALQTRKWTNQQGEERYATEIVLQGFSANLQVLANNKVSEANSNNSDSSADIEDVVNYKDDADISDSVPF